MRNVLSGWGYGLDYLEQTQVLRWMGPRWVAFKPGAKCTHQAQPCKDEFKNAPGENDWVVRGQCGTGWHGTNLTNVLCVLDTGPRGRVSGIYHSEQMETGKGYMKQDDVSCWFEGCEVVIECALLELKVGGLVRFDKERQDRNGRYIPTDHGKLARWKSLCGTVQSVSHTEQTSLRRVFFEFRKDQKELFESSKEAIRRID